MSENIELGKQRNQFSTITSRHSLDPLLVWSNASECAEGLLAVGLGPIQYAAIMGALAGRTPVLYMQDLCLPAGKNGIWQAIVLAAGVRPSPHLLRRILALDGIVVILGSGNRMFDSLKLEFQEHGHIGIEAPFNDEIWWGGLSSPMRSITANKELPLIVSYYTADTPYEEEAQRLIASCKAVGMEHYVEKISNRGSWEANCAYKPTFLARIWRETHKPLLWIDADGILHRKPVLLGGAQCDFAIHKIDRWEFASGTVFFHSTPMLGQLLCRWEALCRSYPNIWDQILLDAAWEELIRMRPLITWWLPSAYTLIFDRPEALKPKDPPVITHHQASRRLKTLVSTQVLPSPKPPMHQLWQQARRASRAWLDKTGNPLAIQHISKPNYIIFPGTPINIPPQFSRYSRRLNRWLSIYTNAGLSIAIFGASWFGIRIATQMRQRGIEPTVFFDNAAEKAGKLLLGIPVKNPAEATSSFDVIIIASIEHSRIIEKQLRDIKPAPSSLILAAHQSRLGHNC